jgi:class 3 adenylate cyclase
VILEWSLVAAAALAVLFGFLWWRSRARVRRLESALDTSARNLEQLQQSFHQFVPREVVEDVIRTGASTRGERIEVTVLFADLVGFTAMSEQVAPETLVKVLNGYFEAMSRAIAANRGHVSKFIGDGILALFGAPDPNPWQAIDGVAAAIEMTRALERYNRELEAQGLPRLGIGIGLHVGPAVAGVIGSRELMEYTVIGDTVNTASRIEGLTRKVGCQVLISGAVRAKLDDRFRLRACEPMPVKGKAEPVATFAVEGLAEGRVAA